MFHQHLVFIFSSVRCDCCRAPPLFIRYVWIKILLTLPISVLVITLPSRGLEMEMVIVDFFFLYSRLCLFSVLLFWTLFFFPTEQINMTAAP